MKNVIRRNSPTGGLFGTSVGSSNLLRASHMRESQHLTAGHMFNRLKKQWWTEVQNTVLLKVSCSCHWLWFGWYRSSNIGGCIVMSAVQQCVLLLRHCLEGAETVFLEGNEHIL